MDSLLVIKPLIAPIGLLVIIVWLSYQIMHLLAVLHANQYLLYRIILFPGILLHEMSHLLACWITNTPVVELNFWSETGGHVVHHKPKNPLIQPLISLAPFGVGISLIVMLSHNLTGEWWMIGGKLLALLIISATLAPSKADLTVALEGIVFLVIMVGGIGWFWPLVWQMILSPLTRLTGSLWLVVTIMGLLWLLGVVIRTTIRR